VGGSPKDGFWLSKQFRLDLHGFGARIKFGILVLGLGFSFKSTVALGLGLRS